MKIAWNCFLPSRGCDRFTLGIQLEWGFGDCTEGRFKHGWQFSISLGVIELLVWG